MSIVDLVNMKKKGSFYFHVWTLEDMNAVFWFYIWEAFAVTALPAVPLSSGQSTPRTTWSMQGECKSWVHRESWLTHYLTPPPPLHMLHRVAEMSERLRHRFDQAISCFPFTTQKSSSVYSLFIQSWALFEDFCVRRAACGQEVYPSEKMKCSSDDCLHWF